MEKTYLEMDLEEWEFLPDDKSFLDSGHGSKKDVLLKEIIVDMNYFICPSHPITSKEGLLPVISVGKSSDDAVGREVKDIGVVAPVIQANQPDVVSQVFFKKLKENEFVDMKMDSPKSNTRGAIMFHAEPEHVQLKENEEEEMEKEKDRTGPEIKGKACCDGFGFTICNWRVAGIGAFCSMGAAAAATICIFIFGGRQQQRNHKIQFKIYTDDKRVKQVLQQTTRLKQALSAARAAPMTRAHITFGGCYTSV
ncbi:uncharacterized protein LOC103990891 [Musa acuminata AAA Group]|uniref:uncharacterized protein LOC103990891 n=1 Tax=Musa acuminata AAA Group TaxID=214697 RepID=UPI0031D0C900